VQTSSSKPIALNPKSKLTLEFGTNLTNRNTRACLSVRNITDTHNKARLLSRFSGVRLWATLQTQYSRDRSVKVGHDIKTSNKAKKTFCDRDWMLLMHDFSEKIPPDTVHQICNQRHCQAHYRLPSIFFSYSRESALFLRTCGTDSIRITTESLVHRFHHCFTGDDFEGANVPPGYRDDRW